MIVTVGVGGCRGESTAKFMICPGDSYLVGFVGTCERSYKSVTGRWICATVKVKGTEHILRCKIATKIHA